MDLNQKIIYGLERLTDAYRTLLWEKAKLHGISPIQIQILLFIANHKSELSNVSHLAKEFNVTKPTISDAVRVLVKKGYLEKSFSPADSRSYLLILTDSGKSMIEEIADYTLPIHQAIQKVNNSELEKLYISLAGLIGNLNKLGIIQVQRTCFGCQFYEKNAEKHYCKFLNKNLIDSEIQLDCPDYIELV